MNTGENTEALRKITDLTRMGSIILLCLHFYIYCYTAFADWHLTHPMVTRVLVNLGNTGLFRHFYISKAGALLLLLVSLVGTKGKKNEKLVLSTVVTLFAAGLVVYVISYLLLYITASAQVIALLYMTFASTGYLLMLNG